MRCEVCWTANSLLENGQKDRLSCSCVFFTLKEISKENYTESIQRAGIIQSG